MKRFLMGTLLGVFSLAATAQTEPASEVRVRGSQIELPARPYHVFLGDFDVYKGGYDLSNGDSMTLLQQGRHLYAVIGDRPKTEMVAASRNEFVAVDRQFKMTLAHDAGEVSGEVLLRGPTSAQANADGGEVIRLLAKR